MTLGHTLFLAQFLCKFSWVQVFWHKFEAEKGLFWNSEDEGNRTPIWLHRATIWMMIWDMLSRKKSEYDFMQSGYDLTTLLALNLTWMIHRAPICSIGVRFTRFWKLIYKRGVDLWSKGSKFWRRNHTFGAGSLSKRWNPTKTHSRSSFTCNEFSFVFSYLCFSHE
jgi:hypothetical protein